MNIKNRNQDDPEKIKKIKELIVKGEINAISVDTTVFDGSKRRLDKGAFAQLKQFGRHPSDLVISEIVLKEINRHMVDDLKKIKSRIERDLLDSWERVGGDVEDLNNLKTTIEKFPEITALCTQRIDAFLEQSKAKVIEAESHINLSQIIGLYFDKKPPFHEENSKKKEFPDAIALASLEAWAIKNKKKVVVVSKDGDWRTFCKDSEHLHLLQDLATALELFQSPDEHAKIVMKYLRESLADESSAQRFGISELLNRFNWYGIAQILAGAHHYDFDIEDVKLSRIDRFELRRDNGMKLIGVGEEFITVSCDFDAEARFSVKFLFKSFDEETQKYNELDRVWLETNSDLAVRAVISIPIKTSRLEIFGIDLQIDDLTLGFGLLDTRFIPEKR